MSSWLDYSEVCMMLNWQKSLSLKPNVWLTMTHWQRGFPATNSRQLDHWNFTIKCLLRRWTSRSDILTFESHADTKKRILQKTRAGNLNWKVCVLLPFWMSECSMINQCCNVSAVGPQISHKIYFLLAKINKLY